MNDAGRRHAPETLGALRLFGSHVRADTRPDRDYDVLAVVEKGSVDIRNALFAVLQSEIPRCDVSLYSASTIRRMFASGHLFAWHLFTESTSLLAGLDLIDHLGVPAPYTHAADDIGALRD